MKRFLIPVILVAFILSIVIFSPAKTVSADNIIDTPIFTSDYFNNLDIDGNLKDFTSGSLRDRTIFTDKEKDAASYIKDSLEKMGADATVETFSIGADGNELFSQNVVAVYNPEKENKVIIGAGYGNIFSSIPSLGYNGNGGAGVCNNGTGVVALLALANYFFNCSPETDYSVNFVFFGGSPLTNTGSGKYMSDTLKGVIHNILLMINLTSLAGEKIYYYTDEVKTAHGDLFKSISKTQDVITDFPKGVPLIPFQLLQNINYTHLGMLSDNYVFLNKKVNTLNIFGSGLLSTSQKPDSLISFNYAYPQFKKGVASVLTAVTDTMLSARFVPIMLSSQNDKFDYSLITSPYFAYGIALILIIIFGVGVIIALRLIYKRSNTPPAIKQKPISVFGDDYDKNSSNDK